MTIQNKNMTLKENVLEFLRLSLFHDQKFIVIQNDFAIGFWKIWKADKNNPKSDFRQLCPNAKVWKQPTTGEWRLYFNESKEDQEYEIQESVNMFNFDNDSRERQTLEDEAREELEAEIQIEIDMEMDEEEPCYYEHLEQKLETELQSENYALDQGMTPADYEHKEHLESMTDEQFADYQAEQDRMEKQFEEMEQQDREDQSIKQELKERFQEQLKDAEENDRHPYYCSKCDHQFTNPQELSEHDCNTEEEYFEDESIPTDEDYYKYAEQQAEKAFYSRQSGYDY